MNKKCTSCGLIYEMEPGFFWGAMYVAYGLTTALVLPGYAFIYFVFDPGIWTAFGIMAFIALLLYGFIFRAARAIWINIFVRYRGQSDIDNYRQEN